MDKERERKREREREREGGGGEEEDENDEGEREREREREYGRTQACSPPFFHFVYIVLYKSKRVVVHSKPVTVCNYYCIVFSF